MIVLLTLTGIPEMLSYAAYVTCIQQRLPPDRQGICYSLPQPLLDIAFALGIASASLPADRVLSLGTCLAPMSLFSTLPIVPLIAFHLRAGRILPAPRQDVAQI